MNKLIAVLLAGLFSAVSFSALAADEAPAVTEATAAVSAPAAPTKVMHKHKHKHKAEKVMKKEEPKAEETK